LISLRRFDARYAMLAAVHDCDARAVAVATGSAGALFEAFRASGFRQGRRSTFSRRSRGEQSRVLARSLNFLVRPFQLFITAYIT
jgi:hypothetical protein